MTGNLKELLGRLDQLAHEALSLWDLPACRLLLLNVSENVTYLVEADGGFKAILRIHRENYHTRRAIECELEWLSALDAAGAVTVPAYYSGRNGEPIQQLGIADLVSPRFMVLFHFVEGSAPAEDGDLLPGFEELGELAARTHQHSIGWTRPERFERLTWDIPQIFGDKPSWGDWRDAPGVNLEIKAVLEPVEATIRRRLEAFGRSKEQYGLIHADMRLANLLVDHDGTRLIDFDDCGFGWFLYDFATGISFIEDDPRVPELKSAWVRGYRKIRALAAEELEIMETFVMLRRMALLAWIGSHIEAPEPQQLAPHFAPATARLGRAYLQDFA